MWKEMNKIVSKETSINITDKSLETVWTIDE